MESWRKVWRVFGELLPVSGMEALAQALITDDMALIQGATTHPPPLVTCQDWPLEAGCLTAYCWWKSGMTTVGQTEEKFAETCFQVDQRLGEPAGCRWLLNWFDETPREEMRRALLPEVQRSLALRRGEPLSPDLDIAEGV